jgi:hypothetical protein
MNLLLADEKSAIHCWELGSDKGETQSDQMLSRVYDSGGPYTPKDLSKSLFYSKAAADHGDLFMMHNTSEMYRLGEGTPVDLLRSGFYDDLENLRKQELRDEATQNRATNPLETLDAMLTSAFLHHITFDDQALRGRVEHRADVIHNLNIGQSRVQAEENAVKEEIASRQKDLDQCYEIHKEDRARYDEEARKYDADARAHGRTPTYVPFHDVCGTDSANLGSYSRGSEKYLACVHQFVNSAAIDTHCTY